MNTIETTETIELILRLADNSLILGHRMSEWCGHGPNLETDIAITNIALDLIGHARNYYELAALYHGDGATEDDFAYLRDARSFKNVLLVELPKGDFGFTIVRQFLFDTYNFEYTQQLCQSADKNIAAIAQKALKEITYHLRWSSEWLIRLGDGTNVSHDKVQDALNDLWMYTDEMLIPDDIDHQCTTMGLGVDHEDLKSKYKKRINEVITKATLQLPETEWMQFGGRQGNHTEYLGFILSDMQWMQRAYPGLEW